MRKVIVQSPSFPEVAPQRSLDSAPGRVWQVLCGDAGHWRFGRYSPEGSRAADCTELERHTCPELFLLAEGRVTLLLFESEGIRELPLEPGKPVLVEVPHNGFCPDGPHGGSAWVVERDRFETEYRVPAEW